jgi:acyl-CoA synthetase (AMP-forming)/AMP-acid ligase II
MDEVNNLPYSSIAGALEYQSKIRPDKVAILYPDPKTNSTEYASLTYKQFNNLTNYLAEKIGNYFSSSESITCAILAVGGIEYFLSQYALLKLENVIMFPISARNSQSAIEHLLKETKTKFLLTTSKYLSMINQIKQDNNQFKYLQVLLLDSKLFEIEELLKHKDIEYSIKQRNNNNKEELNKVVIILHR